MRRKEVPARGLPDANMKTIVTGVFDNLSSATTAFSRFVAEGYDKDALSLVLPDEAETASVSEDKGRAVVESTEPHPRKAATIGAILGASGLALGGLALLPGLIAVGPLAALLIGAGSGAASGGLLGGLIGIGVSRDLAEVYHRSVEGGAVMLGVETTGDRRAEVRQMLTECGGRDLFDVAYRP